MELIAAQISCHLVITDPLLGLSFVCSYGGFATQQKIRELFMMKLRMNDREFEEKKSLMQRWAVDHGLIESMIDKLEQNVHDEDVR